MSHRVAVPDSGKAVLYNHVDYGTGQDIYAFHPDPPAVAESAGLPGGLAKGAAATTLVLLGSLAGLASVGVNICPLVASLGFIGLGISLAAQDLIKDVCDQWAVDFN